MPRVEYDPLLVSDACPYTVIVNPAACADVLQEAGTPEDLITDFTITVDTIDPKRPDRLGIAYRRFPEIVIYAEHAWRTFRDAGKMAKKSVRRERPEATPEELAFLDSAVEENLAERATARLNDTAGHEIRHFLDFFHPKHRLTGRLLFTAGSAITEFTAAGAVLYLEEKRGRDVAQDYAPHIERLVNGLYYQIDPLEVRARRFAKNHPSVRGNTLVTFIPESAAA